MKPYLAVCVLALLSGCSRLQRQEDRFLSVLVTAESIKADGTPWDNGGGDVIPVWGPFMLPSIFSMSPYPDLALAVITEDGSVHEYHKNENRYGIVESDCPNRLACRWEIEVPATGGYFALVASDLDFTLNPNMTLSSVKQALSIAEGEAVEGEKPLICKREFVTARLFGDDLSIDSVRAAALEARVRKWMETAQMSMVPRVSLISDTRGACRKEVCTADAEGNSGSFAISVIPEQNEKPKPSLLTDFWEARNRHPTTR